MYPFLMKPLRLLSFVLLVLGITIVQRHSAAYSIGLTIDIDPNSAEIGHVVSEVDGNYKLSTSSYATEIIGVVTNKPDIALFEKGKEKLTHLAITGNVSVQVTVSNGAIEKGDYITSTHRGHGHCIAMGGDVKRMLAEIAGRSTGYCKGKGGSMHIADLDLGIMGANGIVGAGIPIAVGAAIAMEI